MLQFINKILAVKPLVDIAFTKSLGAIDTPGSTSMNDQHPWWRHV